MSATRRRLAIAGDRLFFALLAAALVIDVTGGFRIGRDWYQISATDPANTLMLAVGVLVTRHLLVPRPSLRQRLTERRRRRLGSTDDVLEPPSGREWLIAAGVMVAATAWLLQDQWRVLTGVPDHGDPLFSMWRLAWVADTIFTAPGRLFDANIFFPATNTLAYSDAMLLPGVLTAPLRWLGLPLAAIHGVLYLLSFVAAGMTMFLLARATTGLMIPALFAALLFAFYPYRFATYSHLEMQGVCFMPLAAYLLLQTLQRARVRDGLWLGVVVVLQTLWSLYLGAYLAVGLGVVAVTRWLAGHVSLRRVVRPLAAAALVSVAVLLPYSQAYWGARTVVGERPRSEIRAYSARVSDYLTAHEFSTIYPPGLAADANAERLLFPGTTVLAGAALALIPPVTPWAAAAVIGAAVSFDATLGVYGAMFTWLYDLAPPYRAFRVPARFATVLGLFLAWLAAHGMARVLRRWPTRPVRIAAMGMLVLTAIELRVRLPLDPIPTSPPGIYAALPADRRVVLVDLPLPAHDGEYWLDPTYLYYSTFHRQTLINGFSGFIPDSYPRLMVASREFPSDFAVEAFRAAGAEFIAIHERFFGDRYSEVVAAVAKRPELEPIASAPTPTGETRLYRLR